MAGHELDSHTLEKTILLGEMESILRSHTNLIRIYQRSVNALNMVLITTRNEDGTITETYELPLDRSGNIIDDIHRVELQEALCINIDLLLAELNGFLSS